MPWITEDSNNYWMPDILPEPTEEHQQEQSEKIYLTPEGKVRMHPGWTYAETIAYVDDEYLFQNEGWKVVIDEEPIEPVSYFRKHYIKNPPEQWNEIDERTVEATYTFDGWIPSVFPEATLEYQQEQREKKYLTPSDKEERHPQWEYTETGAYVNDEYLFQNEGWKVIIDENFPVELKHSVRNTPEDWEEMNEKTVRVTYTLNDFTAEEVAEYKEQKWEILRGKRDVLLRLTDWIIVRAMEENLVVSDEVTSYRQQLRDFPQTVVDILQFNINDDALWPIKPENYFTV